ncbi:MAG: nucleoside:proton symporter [Burkholderiales bacterium 28-67-8]|nr:MAG: nucleoside:proton symporter [Burkholderiales bacterium 28-67-8]
MSFLQSALGVIAMLAVAWLASERRGSVHWRPVWSGIALALVLAAAIRWVPGVGAAIAATNEVLDALMNATRAGTAMVFGHLGGGPLPYEPTHPEATFVLAAQALPLVLVVSALSAVLFHWGILSRLVEAFAWLLQRTMGIGGAVGVSAAANAFVGMVEGPLVVRPWLAKMSRGELFMTMNCGMATIAGTVLVLYAAILKPVMPDAMAHLLAASVIAIPVALAVAAIMVPTDRGDGVSIRFEREDDSAMAALTRGTTDGLQLLLGIIAMLIVVVALVTLVNSGLKWLPDVGGAPLSAERMLGVVFAPLAWAVGVPWSEAGAAGQLLGEKTVLNEFVAYLHMAALPDQALSPHSRLLMTYALAGFANFGSVGIMLGGLSPLLPADRRADLGYLALKSVPAGLLSTCITAALVGLIY